MAVCNQNVHSSCNFIYELVKGTVDNIANNAGFTGDVLVYCGYTVGAK